MTEFLLGLIERLKRPLFRRIAQVAFAAGVALLATAYGGGLLPTREGQPFSLEFMPGGNGPWGLALVIAALAYGFACTALLNFLIQSREARKERERRLHELAILQRSRDILPEKELLSYLKWLVADHSIRSGVSARVQSFATYHEKEGNVYLDGELQRAALAVGKNFQTLLEWMSSTFKVYPEDQTGEDIKLCMLPHLNSNRAGKGLPEKVSQYDEAACTLKELSDEVGVSYTTYREALKEKLLIDD